MRAILGIVALLCGIIFSLENSAMAQGAPSEIIEDWSTHWSTDQKINFEPVQDPTALNNKKIIDENRRDIEKLEETGIIQVVSPKDIEATQLPNDPETLKSLRTATQALLMRESGNIVFTGAPGVGKSYRLALMLAYIQKFAPPELKQRVYVRGSSSAFAARKDGYAGTIEENVRKLVELSEKVPLTILFDEIHTLDGAGTHRNSSVDVLERLKDSIASGRIKIIGTTTAFEFETYISSRRALAERFVKVDVKEPSQEDLVRILKKRYYEDTERELPKVILDEILQISKTFGGTFAEPRRSIKLLDFMVSREKLDQILIQDREQFIKIASEYFSMDLELFLDSTKNENLVRTAEAASNEKLIGLEGPIQEAFKSIRYWMSQDERAKPLSLMVYGSKGTGKTVFSSSIAESLKYKFLKISLPSFNAEQVLSQIVTQLEMYPFTIFLLDEVEKADPRVLNKLLSVLDSPYVNEQKLLSNGEKGEVVSVSTRNAIFISTTNDGEDLPLVAMSSEQAKEQIAAKGKINPYYMDRQRKAIRFYPPGVDALRKIVEKNWKRAAKGFLAEAEKAGVTMDRVFSAVINQLVENPTPKRSIGFIIDQAPAEPILDVSKLSTRVVENIVDNVAENVLFFIRNPERLTAYSAPSAGGQCLPLFLKK